MTGAHISIPNWYHVHQYMQLISPDWTLTILTTDLRLPHAAILPFNAGNHWVSSGHQLARSGHKQGLSDWSMQTWTGVVKTQLHNPVPHWSATLLPSGLWKQWFEVIWEQSPSPLCEYFKAVVLQEGTSSSPYPCIGLQIQPGRTVYPGAVRGLFWRGRYQKVSKEKETHRWTFRQISISNNFFHCSFPACWYITLIIKMTLSPFAFFLPTTTPVDRFTV